jgi:hypothetical protein
MLSLSPSPFVEGTLADVPGTNDTEEKEAALVSVARDVPADTD